MAIILPQQPPPPRLKLRQRQPLVAQRRLFFSRHSELSPSASPSIAPTNNGLSISAKAEISVGISLGVLGLCAMVATVLLVRGRRNGRMTTEPQEWKHELEAPGKADPMYAHLIELPESKAECEREPLPPGELPG